MRSHRHSRTAEATAAIRAGHLLYDAPHVFVDPFALDLTSPLWRTVCRYPLLYWPIVRGVFARLRPVHGWILVRDQVTVELLQAFVSGGGGQYVLLGAGFDSIALRRPPWLDGVRVYEVDHPATQAVKLSRVARLTGGAGARGFEAVGIDFERETLGAALARSSFERARPSFFAWQGVIYYLSARAIEDTLAQVAAHAAPGSELLFDFLLPRHAQASDRKSVMHLARAITRSLGERYVSFHLPDQIERLVKVAGFDVIDILRDDALEARYIGERADGLSVMRGFGIVHARRR